MEKRRTTMTKRKQSTNLDQSMVKRHRQSESACDRELLRHPNNTTHATGACTSERRHPNNTTHATGECTSERRHHNASHAIGARPDATCTSERRHEHNTLHATRADSQTHQQHTHCSNNRIQAHSSAALLQRCINPQRRPDVTAPPGGGGDDDDERRHSLQDGARERQLSDERRAQTRRVRRWGNERHDRRVTTRCRPLRDDGGDDGGSNVKHDFARLERNQVS